MTLQNEIRLLFLIILIVNVTLFLVHRKQRRANLTSHIYAINELSAWLFDQLYKSNSDVVSLNKFEITPEKRKKLESLIYSPSEDPRAEFNGLRDDFNE